MGGDPAWVAPQTNLAPANLPRRGSFLGTDAKGQLAPIRRLSWLDYAVHWVRFRGWSLLTLWATTGHAAVLALFDKLSQQGK